jgi:hypothetical protein
LQPAIMSFIRNRVNDYVGKSAPGEKGP